MSRAADIQIVTKLEIHIVIQSEDLTIRHPMVNKYTVRYSDSQTIIKLNSMTCENGHKLRYILISYS